MTTKPNPTSSTLTDWWPLYYDDEPPPCTGLTSWWCPNHGDCTCPRPYGEFSEFSDHCRLHGHLSDHAEYDADTE